MIAIAFAGQGGQHAGMGSELFAQYPNLVREADMVLGYSIAELCATGGPRLNQTRFTQPAVYVVGVLAWHEFLRRTGATPNRLLGHSVGEYVALYAAGIVDFATGLRIVNARADAMSRCGGDGGMAALVGPRARIIALADEISDVYLANDNAPTQIVAAGTRDGLTALEARTRQEPLVTFIPLAVSGPFHSPLMNDARASFADFLASQPLEAARIPVMSNVTARPHQSGLIRQRLIDHLVQPVRWLDSVRHLIQEGPVLFQDLGPGRATGSLLRQIIEQKH